MSLRMDAAERNFQRKRDYKNGSAERLSVEDERLMIKHGFLNTTLDETLLYRIVDLTFQQSLAGKIFGTGNIILKTKVDATPEIVLKNIKKPLEVRRLLSQAIEESRRNRNVVGKEFYGGSVHEHMDMDEDPDNEEE